MAGTELSLAYGSSIDDNSFSRGSSYAKNSHLSYSNGNGSVGREESYKQSESKVNLELPLPKLTSAPMQPPVDMFAKQGNTFENYTVDNGESTKNSYRAPQDSFWDRIGRKKLEVLKMFVLSLIVVLGMSLNSITSYYLDGYIAKSFLTEMQEFIVRLSYPVAVILLIWIIKATN